MKKRLLAFMLTAAMILGMGTVAMATDANLKSEAKSAAITLKKVYDVQGATNDTLYPSETLNFNVTADSSNPDTTLITVDNLTVAGNANQTINVNLPVYSKVGTYKYTIKETAGSVQGVTYTNAGIDVSVLVTYNEKHTELVSKIVLSTAEKKNDEIYKVDTFTNTYEVGTLTVKKVIDGNLASKDAYFTMALTLNSEKTVASAITISGGSNDSNPTSIAANEWTTTQDGKYTVTKNFYLKADDTLTFANIPEGITYSVAENVQHILGKSETFDPNSAADKQYTVTYTSQSGTIAAKETINVTVKNEKKTDIKTGIDLDNMPYVIMIAVVFLAAAVVVIRRKRYTAM